MLLYLCLKLIAKTALRVFFRRIDVPHRQRLLTQGPLIIVANHPNTFMDPLIPAALLRQRSAFIAKGSIFNGFTRPIFKYLHVIAVYRKKDTADVQMSQAELNKFTFQQCYDYLANRGTIMIFPEGTSELERRLREIKTGAARIALGAEFEHNFGLGVKIIPVGINYTDPTQFRSDVFVNIGEAIEVADFKNQYHPESFASVEALTQLIENRLSELVIITEDEQEDSIVRNVEQLYKNQLFEDLNVIPNSKTTYFSLVRQIVQAVRYFEQQRPDLLKEMQIKMANYLKNLQMLGISDATLAQTKRFSRQILANFTVLLGGLPLFIYGLINNYLPYILPSYIAKKISSDRGYRAPIMMTAGIFLFPIFYGIQIFLVHTLLQKSWLSVIYAVSLPLSGFFAWWYWPFVRRFRSAWQARKIFQKKPSLLQNLLAQRHVIFESLEEAKKVYLAVNSDYQNPVLQPPPPPKIK